MFTRYPDCLMEAAVLSAATREKNPAAIKGNKFRRPMVRKRSKVIFYINFLQPKVL